MKIIKFDDPAVFSQLEDQAIDGVLNYSDFPPEEYKYFSRLAKLGYMNRHKGWSAELCQAKQSELLDTYSEEKAKANEHYALCRQLDDSRIQAEQYVTAMYKAKTKDQILENALKAIELLKREPGLKQRINKKMKKMEERTI